MAVNTIVLTIVFFLAGYLRAHNREPLMAASVVGAVAVGGLTYLLGRYAGAEAMVYGYVAYNVLVGFPWVLAVFRANRAEQHAEQHAAPVGAGESP